MSSGQPQSARSSSSALQLVDHQQRSILRYLLGESTAVVRQVELYVKEFTKSREQANIQTLMNLLEHLTRKKPDAKIAFKEVKDNVHNMEPIEMLDNFLQTYQFRSDLRRSREFGGPYPWEAMKEVRNEASTAQKDSDLSTTPVVETSISDIKTRVLAAATGGLSKTARSTPLLATSNPLPSSYYLDISGIQSPGVKFGRRQIWQSQNGETVPFKTTSALALPTTAQEKVMISELLSSLIACSTRYISRTAILSGNASNLHEIKFTISDDINCSLRQMVEHMIPMGSQYAMIDEFILQQEELGSHGDIPLNRSSQTLQALASALDEVMYEYRAKLVDLEADLHCLTMSKVLHTLRNTQHTMSVCAQTVLFIRSRDLNAAQILSYLNDKITSGDEVAHSVHVFLAQRAAVPFIAILEEWVVKGVIVDPMGEFMLEEKLRVIKDVNAMDRYVLCADRIPHFLRNVSDMILRTGKYLNVIRNCGHQVYRQMNEPLRFVPQMKQHLAYLKAAYDYSSHRLLEILVKEKDLMGHLTSVKRYLLMQQGDFIVQYMDTIDDELWKPALKMNANKMASLLELTLRLSSANDDAYKDELLNDPSDHDLVQEVSAIHKQKLMKDGEPPIDIEFKHLKGFESFCFSFVAPWPVSLVINRDTLQPYKMVFRMLFLLKHVERQLSKVWIHNKFAKKLETKMNEAQRGSFSVSHSMLHTIQNIEYYMMLEVIEPLWQKFLQKMESVRNVDEVLAAHKSFTDELAQQGMMHSPELVQAIVQICNVCIRFSQMVLTENVNLPSKAFELKVDEFKKIFTKYLMDFLEKMVDPAYSTTTDSLLNLVRRLNFNLFFTNQLEAIPKKRLDVPDDN